MAWSGSRAGSGASALLLAVVLSACGTGDDQPAASSSSADASASAGPSDDNSVSASPSLPPDPVVKKYKRVLRAGKLPRPTVTAPIAAFDGTIRYTDGLTLAVTGVKQATVTDQGPGEFTGQPKTRLSLRMTNDGDTEVALDQVVVTALYGSPRRQARPVYDDRSQDFSGVLKPGSSAKAVYTFSVPKAQLGRVTLYVDFDGRHTVATFQGDPRSAG